MSKKTYLLLALLCVGVVLSMVPAFAAAPREDVKTWNISSSNPGWTLDGDWAYGKPQGLGGIDGAGKDPPASVGNVLGTNLAGNYSADTASYAVSTELDLSGKVGCQLSFTAWLDVQDNLHDQATVEISNDGGDSWTEVWANGADADTLDTAFTTDETVDISGDADGQAILIRFGLVSDGSIEYGGWNVNKVVVSANADAIANEWLMGATNDLTGGGWLLDSGWTVGAASGGGGQTIDSVLVGADPTENADGVADGLVLGYNVGGNYERGMGRKFATSPELDFSSSTAVKLNYARWLAIEDAAAGSQARVEINLDPALAEVAADDFSGDLADYTVSGTGVPAPEIVDGTLVISGKEAVSRVIDTSEYYEIEVSADLGATFDTGTGSFKMQWRKRATDSWTDLATITADQDLTTAGPFAITADLGAEDNANFEIRFVSNGLQTDVVSVDNILVEGVKWANLYQNPTGENVFDDAWVDESLDLSGIVDGEATVRVRWVMGPTSARVPISPQPDHEFGGWSVDNIEFTAGTFAWLTDGVSLPASLEWESEGDATFSVKNYGTGYWDDTFAFVLTDSDTPTAPITGRWGADSTSVEDTVAAGDIYDFNFTLTAPPISSIMYAEGATPTDPGDPDLSALDINGRVEKDEALVDPYDNLSGDNPIPTGLIVTSRFPDIQPDTDGFWARYWVEELSGRIPVVVKGYAETEGFSYRPTVEIDRAAMAVYIQRSMRLELKDYKGIFIDVPGPEDPDGRIEHWAWPQIEAIQRAGVAQGIPPTYTNYAPAGIVTRDQMAKFIWNGMTGAAVPPTPTEAPFDDVPLLLPGTTTPNVYAPFIAGVKDANVVQGYEDTTEPLGVTYRPAGPVTRDQLAVFVWRAFMRESGAAVVLAGPGVTDADLSDSAVVDYPGWQSVGVADSWDASNYMYVQLDALRMKDDLIFTPSGTFDVKFELRKPDEDAASAARTWSFPLSATDISDAVDAASASGSPYYSLYELVPAGSPTPSAALADAFHGDFTFVVSVRMPSGASDANWYEAERKPGYMSYGRTFFDDFNSGISGDWDLTGDPADPTGAPAVGDLVGLAAKFVQTGTMEQAIDLTGWNSLVVSANVLATFLSADDVFTIEYSVDGGTNWTEGYSLSDVAKIDTADLPDATAEAVEFELPASANENANFMIRIGLAGGSLDSIVYLDDLQIKGL